MDKSLITSPINYALCTTQKAFKRELRELGIEDNSDFIVGNAHAMIHFYEDTITGGTCAIVCIDGRDKTLEQVYALLTHEAMHLWREIKTELGEKFPSEEFEAYAMQHIVSNLFESYKHQTKR
jgi:hypothetical protein